MLRNDSQDPVRRYPLRMPPDWTPPVPAWSSVFSDTLTGVCMAVVGCQHDNRVDVSAFMEDLKKLAATAELADFCSCDEGDGRTQTGAILYWSDQSSCIDWFSSEAFAEFWNFHGDEMRGYGIFREVFNVPFGRFETLFSGTEHDHGFSQLREDLTGPVQRHQYWGGMRDRIPDSATEAFQAAGPVRIVEQTDNRIVVAANENLCIIRSGQDWTETRGEQRSEYLEKIEPVLKQGMEFLRDRGNEVGCYACRYMRESDDSGVHADRSFGLAYFRSMGDLESWAEHHPTHLAIFNAFLEIAPKYGPDLQLRLWHEVSVLPAGDQQGEYVNCTPGTGLMGGLAR